MTHTYTYTTEDDFVDYFDDDYLVRMEDRIMKLRRILKVCGYCSGDVCICHWRTKQLDLFLDGHTYWRSV